MSERGGKSDGIALQDLVLIAVDHIGRYSSVAAAASGGPLVAYCLWVCQLLLACVSSEYLYGQ